MFGEFGKSSVICQIKTIQISTYNLIAFLADLFIRQTFLDKCSKRVNSLNFFPAKLSNYMVSLVIIQGDSKEEHLRKMLHHASTFYSMSIQIMWDELASMHSQICLVNFVCYDSSVTVHGRYPLLWHVIITCI